MVENPALGAGQEQMPHLGVGIDAPTIQAHDSQFRILQRHYNTTQKVLFALGVENTKFYKALPGLTALRHRLQKRAVTEPNPKVTPHLDITESAALQVGPGFLVLGQAAFIMLHDPPQKLRVVRAGTSRRPGRRRACPQLAARQGMELLHSFTKCQALGLLKKREDVALGFAAETVVKLLLRVDHKGCLLIIVPRAAHQKVLARLFEFETAGAHQLGQVDAGFQLV